MNKKLGLKLLGASLLLIVLIASFVLINGKTEYSLVPSKAGKPVTDFLPSFFRISEVAEREGEKWIASYPSALLVKDGKVKFFTQQDGLPSNVQWSVINHKDQIWYALDGGVAKYNDKTGRFDPYLKGTIGERLFEDPYTRTMYLSAFKEFYWFDDQKNEWVRSLEGPAPAHSDQMIFTDQYAFSSSFPSSLPAVVLNKNSTDKRWERSIIPEFGDQQLLKLFKVNGRVFIYGRSKDYNNCSDQGKEPASIFFEHKGRDKNNKDIWLRNDVLTEHFSNYEPYIVSETSADEKEVTFSYGSSCSKQKTGGQFATFDFSDDTVVLKTINVEYKKKEDYSSLVTEIEQMTGQPAYKDIRAIDKKGNLYVLTNDNQNALSVFKADQGYKPIEILSKEKLKDFNRTVPVMCDNPDGTQNVYVIAYGINEMGGEIYSGKIYSYDNNTPTEIVVSKETSLSLPNEESPVICRGNVIYYLDYDSKLNKLVIRKLDLAKKDLAVIAESSEKGFSRGAASEEGFWFLSNDNKKVYYFNVPDSKISEKSLGEVNPSGKELSILLAEKDRLWLGSATDKETILVDSNGKKLNEFFILPFENNKSFVAIGQHKYLISNDKGIFIVNAANGTVKAFDYKKLPFWGDEANFMPEIITYQFFIDQSRNKIWLNMFGSRGAFSLPLNQFK